MDRRWILLVSALVLAASETHSCQGPEEYQGHISDDDSSFFDDVFFSESRFDSDEQRLMRYLVSYYDNSVRPVYNALMPVDVKLGLTLTQILDLDEKNQVLTTNVWLEAEWFDERLNWTNSDFGGISSIRIPCHKLWLPDIVLYNSVDDYTSGYMPSLAMVYNTSKVFWGPVIRFRSSCKIDITFFPFDTQMCTLKLGSWAYNGFQVNVWNNSDTMDLSNFVDNGEWELLDVGVRRHVKYYNCCIEPFPDVTFVVQLRRRTKYYFMNIIVPCIILSFLCLAGFLLPPESGEKITLGLSVLLTITVFMLMVADKMPHTSESISVISIYLMAVLATSCLSVLSSVLVLRIHHRRGTPSRAPGWLRKFCFQIVLPILRIKLRRQAPHRFPHYNNNAPDPQNQNTHKSRARKEPRFRLGRRVSYKEEESECLRMKHNAEPSHGDFKKWTQINVMDYCKTNSVATPADHLGSERVNVGWPSSRQDTVGMADAETDTSFTVRSDLDAGGGYTDGDGDVDELIGGGDAGGGCNNGGGQYDKPCGDDICDNDISDESSCSDNDEDDNVSDEDNTSPQVGSRSNSTHVHFSPSPRRDQQGLEPCTRWGRSSTDRWAKSSAIVRHLIGLIQAKQKEEMRDEDIFQEWRDVAFVIDRLLFILFTLITIVSTVCILEMRPPPTKI